MVKYYSDSVIIDAIKKIVMEVKISHGIVFRNSTVWNGLWNPGTETAINARRCEDA